MAGLPSRFLVEVGLFGLERPPGVRKADVSYPNETAHIEYDDDSVDEEDLKDAVKEAGYILERQPA